MHIVLFVIYGANQLYDSKLYNDSAEYFLKNGSLESSDRYFYLVPIATIAFSKSLFNGSVIPYILLQIAISGIGIYCLFKAALKYFDSVIVATTTALIMLFWIEIIRWNVMVMTESLFCSLVCIALYRFVVFKGHRSEMIFLLALGALLAFSRPTGILIVLAILVFLCQFYWRLTKGNKWSLFTVYSILIVLVTLASFKMFSMWDFTDEYAKGNVVTYADKVAGTSLDRTYLRVDNGDLWIPPPASHPLLKVLLFVAHNPIHFLKAGTLKLVYLLFGVRPYYSILHNCFSALWMTILYIAVGLTITHARTTPTTIAVAVIFVGNCLIVAMATVDWDNRFYVPMAPGIALLAGNGVIELLARFHFISKGDQPR
jgi:hypothetical protein